MKHDFISVVWLITLVSLFAFEADARDIYVSPKGNDNYRGTEKKPFLTFERATKELLRFAGKEPVNIWFAEGDYHIEKTVQLTAEYSGTEENPVIFSSLAGHHVQVKGSMVLNALQWKAYKDGIFFAKIPDGLDFDQLFINGLRQVRARFPDMDENNPLRNGQGYLPAAGGTDKRYDQWLAVDSQTFTKKTWAHPETGIVHVFQSHNWGNMQYRIKAVESGKIILGEGGWQMQRIPGIGNGSPFSIDNIFEELDEPAEWFLDAENRLLYLYPAGDIDLDKATIEVPVVKDLVRLTGSNAHPVKFITFKGFHFSQSGCSFMEPYEPVSRGDWAIHRGGAIFMEGVENCSIEDCRFEYLGGNGIFMSSYNRNNTVSGCYFTHNGESAVCFVGSAEAVRTYQTWDERDINGIPWKTQAEADLLPGPKTPDYPDNCTVKNCIMHDFGDFGKQVAGVFISKSHHINVSHCTIYNCPRAAICINDGTWGGHIIEYCDIWETVRETGEHGPFNAWGRDRFWAEWTPALRKQQVALDAIDTTVIRNNRIANFRKSVSAGNWTIDLDDGSSRYAIYNNLNLGSTIKLREGFFRKVYNNISISAVPLGWHVWPENSEDEVFQNIFVISGSVAGSQQPTAVFVRPIALPATKWSNHYNHNTYWNINYKSNPFMMEGQSFAQWQAQGYDLQSIIAAPSFVNPEKGDYRVTDNSPALKIGFKNFPMDKFGHQMTKIEPFGGYFTGECTVAIKPDARMDAAGSVRYTTDGSQPTPQSPLFHTPLLINQSCTIKALSFDKDGNALGFVCTATFDQTTDITYPNWYKTLLTDEYGENGSGEATKAPVYELEGAVFIDISGDADLIDASGGNNFGCYIRSIHSEKGKIWKEAGLEPHWIIQQIEGKEVRNGGDLTRTLNEYRNKTITIVAVRNNTSKIFRVELK
ncbi:MAG: right-handed parallel beta-helix repeat-containing protein [Bacteroidales bacterium]|jgi:hypothetical protein|nr:right-handed parallel beta-helix repeat-containing protein [Bacteroidales bacterium]